MNPSLVWHVLYPLYHRFKGNRFFEDLAVLQANARLSPEALEQMQSEKLKALIRHAYKTTPFYRGRMDCLGLDYRSLHLPEMYRRLPTLTKKDIQQNRSKMMSIRVGPGQVRQNSTSGSTGEKLKFANDQKSMGLRMAAGVRYNLWFGIHPGERIATLWGAPMDVSKGKAARGRLHAFFTNSMLLSSYDLDDGTMAVYIRKLNRFKPALMISYPGPLTVFARYIVDRKQAITGLKAIVSSAETLFGWQREIIEEAFQCKIYNRYGCREFGNIAHECTLQDGLHISTDRVYLELLDETGKIITEPGIVGEVVVTDLDNFGMPFLRYRIGDMASFKAGTCPCGRPFPMLERVQGRTLAIIRAENGARLGGTFWTLLFRSRKGFASFQVIQEEMTGIKVKYVADSDGGPQNFDHFSREIRQKCGDHFSIEYEQVDYIPKTGSGKTRFVISRLEKS